MEDEIKVIVCQINEYCDNIINKSKSKSKSKPKNAFGEIDLKRIQDRKESIFKVKNLISELSKTLEETNSKLKNLEEIQSKEVLVVEKFISVISQEEKTNTKTLANFSKEEIEKTQEEWKIIKGKKNKKPEEKPKLEILQTTTQFNAPSTTNDSYSKINITSKIAINAISVDTVKDLRNMHTGELYFVKSVGHFAVKIANILFHGNIGKIFTNEPEPNKIKNCKYAEKCINSKCNYYHDPFASDTGDNHNDVRNYIAGSFVYTPMGNPYRNKYRSRRFGSFENLDVDLVTITEEEMERYLDQTMHDILCSIVLKNAFTE